MIKSILDMAKLDFAFPFSDYDTIKKKVLSQGYRDLILFIARNSSSPPLQLEPKRRKLLANWICRFGNLLNVLLSSWLIIEAANLSKTSGGMRAGKLTGYAIPTSSSNAPHFAACVHCCWKFNSKSWKFDSPNWKSLNTFHGEFWRFVGRCILSDSVNLLQYQVQASCRQANIWAFHVNFFCKSIKPFKYEL